MTNTSHQLNETDLQEAREIFNQIENPLSLSLIESSNQPIRRLGSTIAAINIQAQLRGTTPPYREFFEDNSEIQLKRSVVSVLYGNEYESGVSEGTGVVVARQDNSIYILTARHVVFNENNERKSDTFRVEFYSDPVENQERLRLYAEIVDWSLTSPDLDLVLLKVSGGVPEDIQPLELASSQPTVDQALLAVGHPSSSSEPWLVTEVMLRGSVEGFPSILQVSLPEISTPEAVQGYSGGPIINNENQLIGIIFESEQIESGTNLVSAYSPELLKLVLQGWGVLQ